MSDSKGEDEDDVDIRDLFDGPQIEQNLHQLDNDRQQQITVTVEVHAHVDEVKNLIDYIVYSICDAAQVWGGPRAMEHTKECLLPRRLGC